MDTSMMILLAAVVVGILYVMNSANQPVVVAPSPPTSAQTADYIQSLSQPTKDVAVIHALSSGTGDKTILMQMFPLTATSVARYGVQLPNGTWRQAQSGEQTTLVPYSGGFNDAGFDDLGRYDVNSTVELDDSGGRWITNSQNPQFMLQENFMFFADQLTQGEFSVVTDCDGAKQIPFAHHTQGDPVAVKKIFFGSFKVNPGILMMITVWPKGGTPTYGFILNGHDCRDVIGYIPDPSDSPAQQIAKAGDMPGLLGEYKELTDGNNGIMWDRDIEADWTITVLNKHYFHKYMLQKFNACLDVALGVGGDPDVDNGLDDNRVKGLHYMDGVQIHNPTHPEQLQFGRWLYDENCNPVINPGGDHPGYQAYVRGPRGWGLTCQDAYAYCALDPGLLVGVSLKDADVNDFGVPNFVGIEDPSLMGVTGVAKKRADLDATHLGWEFPTIDPVKKTPVSAIKAPTNAKATLSGLATGAVAPITPITTKSAADLAATATASSFTAVPKSWLGRASTMSHSSMTSGPDGDSFTNVINRTGHTSHKDPFAMIHASELS